MSFSIKDVELLEKYNETLVEKLAIVSKKGFDSELVYNKKYPKTKIKSYEGKSNKKFHYNKIPKKCYQCIFSISNID